ncbi:MAG: Phosphoribosylaminoimidazole-succinocarboxamide synthase [Phycisphaerae bacterium]|nr:Phosphoribosylaminoimidazole-succinocarboxamide synthase [Phycisphaerae bacterium]
MSIDAIRETHLPGLVKRGKVRDLYDLGDRLMIVASDRISAFDVVMDQPIPDKGAVLTRLTKFWLTHLPACAPHHLDYVVSGGRVPAGYSEAADMLAERAMVVRKAAVLPVECVVRGYLVGGGWKEYTATGRVSGVELPRGMAIAQQLSEPIFTPSTKAEHGHDEAITFERACELAGERWMVEARRRSLAIYSQAAELAACRGIILADSKFEFGVTDGELLLVDEVLTPDSSRFWPAESYRVGSNPPSFDKQYLRDYLESLDWPKRPPPPAIPAGVIEQTRRRYVEAYERLSGERFCE